MAEVQDRTTGAMEQAVAAAGLILDTFSAYHEEFQRITRRARQSFEQRDWQQLHEDAETRLDLHGSFVYSAVEAIKEQMGDLTEDAQFWVEVKREYTRLISMRGDFDTAQTFYNSVAKRAGTADGIEPDMHYVGNELQMPPPLEVEPLYNAYRHEGSTTDVVRQILDDHPFTCGYHDAGRSAARVAERIDSALQEAGWHEPIATIEVARHEFYRGQLAFIVGRIGNHSRYAPLVIALANRDGAVTVDAVLLDEVEVSILFSFARWYFNVEVETPYALVSFLRSILPRKPVAELYISIGYNKHGKTELYRDLIRHLERSTDKFEIARGERGMVMVVFTLPSYDVVFKIIKDRFDYPKTTTNEQVRNRYHLVFKHDRGGRLVDAQEFEYLRFKKDRFSPELLEELLQVAANTVTVEGDEVVVKHLYAERKLEPLNLYVREAPQEEAAEAVKDLGQALKDLAATNIFPGDILLKNFGVTRHGRVVFYDYDELCLVTDCNFREMPQTDDFDDEMSSEPWYSVGEQDVFPEELHNFMGLPPNLKTIFMQEHGELFTAEFWADLKNRYVEGQIIDVIPYKEQHRLEHPVESC